MTSADRLKYNLIAAIRSVERRRHHFCQNPARDFTRDRKQTMGSTITALIVMTGGTLQRELYKYAAAGNVEISSSAFCQNRAKIKPEAFREVFRVFNMKCADEDAKKSRGYHLYAVDGSCINMARNPDSPCFVSYESNPRGYCQFHLNAWYDLENKIYFDAHLQPQPRADERAALMDMIERNRFQGKNILALDRGYESYLVFYTILAKENLDFVCRIKDSKGCMKPLKNWPMTELDRDVEVVITTSQKEYKEHKDEGYVLIQTRKHEGRRKYSAKTRNGRWPFEKPYALKFRIVRFLLPTGQYETIATSLDRSFSVDDIRTIYARRWGVESSFRALKYMVNLTNLHGRSDDFVYQEIYAALTAYNFASRVVNAIVVEQKPKCVYAYQVNFTMAVYLCREFLRQPRGSGEALLERIQKYMEPIRPGRADKRKIRPKSFVAFNYRVAA